MSLYMLTEGAEEDWEGIVEYTLDHFGDRQLMKYTDNLVGCIEKFAKEEGSLGGIELDQFVVRMKRCQKHYVFASVKSGQPLIILAILHERMDWMKRLKDRLTKR